MIVFSLIWFLHLNYLNCFNFRRIYIRSNLIWFVMIASSCNRPETHETFDKLTNCFWRLAASPRNGPLRNCESSVSLRITHSVSSRNDKSNAFQCSEFDSNRFLKQKKEITIQIPGKICYQIKFKKIYLFLFVRNWNE